MAEFAGAAQLAGFGLVLNPMFEDARLFRRGIGDESDVVRKEMYEFADRGGRPWPCAPRARPRWCGPSSSTARRCRGRRGTSPPPSATSGPRPGRYRQHHQLGVEVLGTEDPDLDVEVVDPGRRTSTPAGAPPGRAGAQLHGMRRSAGPPTSPRCSPIWTSTATSCATSTGSATASNPLRVLDCKRPRVPGRDRGRPPHRSTTSTRRAPPTWPGCGPASTRSASRTGSNPAWCAASTTTPAPRSSSPALSLDAAQNAVGGGGRYDGLAEAIGGPPTPGIGFGIGIERLLLACDAEGLFAVDPPPARRLRGRRDRGDRGPRPVRRAAPGRPGGGAGLRWPLAQGPAEAGGPLGGPLRRSSSVPRSWPAGS